MLWPKKNSYKEFDNKKNSCGSKIPLLPHNFSNSPSLIVNIPLNQVGHLMPITQPNTPSRE